MRGPKKCHAFLAVMAMLVANEVRKNTDKPPLQVWKHSCSCSCEPMAISFQQISSAMPVESAQIGYMPPVDNINAENLMSLVAFCQTKGFDFVVSPINAPGYRRVLFESDGPQSPEMMTWRAGQQAFTPEDLVLRTAGNNLRFDHLPVNSVHSYSTLY